MSDKENADIKALKEWALGTEFDRKKGFNYKFDAHVCDTDDRLCKIENRISNLEKKRTFIGGLKSFILLFAK